MRSHKCRSVSFSSYSVAKKKKKKNQSTTRWVTDKEDKVNSNCKNSAWEANIQRVNKSQINKPNFLML